MDDNSFVGVVDAASGNLCGSYSILGTGSNTWIIDTGHSDHMTYYAKFFDELSSTTRDPYITSVNGLPSPITRESTISLTPTLSFSHVWGPARVTSNGFRWFVTFIDDCTRLTWVYLMKNKHDVASILSEFCAMVFTQFHVQVKVFQTDNRAEYVNNPLTHFFRDQGIIHPTTTPFTPQQNGVFEGKNRQLLEVARSLLLDMSVPHHLWGHGVLAAAYLINCTSSWVLDFKTPLDVLCAHTSLVSVSKLPPKVFGCVAYVHVYSHQQSKLDPCDLRCVFIDYSTTQKGYKCYHPHTQKVHVILDVTFHEDVPYYVSPSSPNQGERGSKLGSLGLQDLELRDVGEDDTNDDLGEKMTYRRVDSAWSHRSEAEEDTFCPETTGRPNGRD
ncbi:unnamed protein product [Prunus armeniaca]